MEKMEEDPTIVVVGNYDQLWKRYRKKNLLYSHVKKKKRRQHGKEQEQHENLGSVVADEIWQVTEKNTRGLVRSLKIVSKKQWNRSKFIQHVTILKECNGHPNLPNVHNVYECDHYYYIIMDNIDHPTLVERIVEVANKAVQENRKTTLTLEQIIGKTIKTLVNVLVYLHKEDESSNKLFKRTIVHGAIHHNNILVPRSGDEEDSGEAIFDNLLLINFSNSYMDMGNYAASIDIDETDYDDDSSSGSDDAGEYNKDTTDTGLHQHISSTNQRRKKIQKLTRYQPPEFHDDVHIHAAADCDNKAQPVIPTTMGDMYALGVLTFFLLTGGKYPYNKHAEAKEGVIREWYSIKGGKIQSFIQALVGSSPPESRPTAQQTNAFAGAWATSTRLEEDDDDCWKDVMNRLANIHKEQQLKVAVRSYIASNFLRDTRRDRLSQIFRTLDTTNTNSLTRGEFAMAMLEAKIPFEPTMFDTIDTNNNQHISYTDFMAFATREEVLFDKKRLRAAFDAFDWSHTGYITKLDLLNFSTSASGSSAFRNSQTLSSTTLTQMLQQADTNGDGKISFDEFTNMILR